MDAITVNTLQTITTIELSSACNLECKYCVSQFIRSGKFRVNGKDVKVERRFGIMSDMVFNATLEVLGQLVTQGTQRTINLNGNGESTLDGDLVKRVRAVKDVVGADVDVNFTTNGLTMNEDYAIRLKEAGIDRIDVSVHDVDSAIKANYILRHKAQVNGFVTVGHVVFPHNWAGQLQVTEDVPFKLLCEPLLEGRGYIQSEGDVVPCCYDFRNLGKYGHVFDDDLLEKPIKTFELCKTCHQFLPEGVVEHVDNDASVHGDGFTSSNV